MIKFWKRVFGSDGSFRRNSLIMSSGAIVNIGISFFLTPIVTRIYSKEEFGVFYIYASVVAIGTLIINGMYPHAFVVPKKKEHFLALLKFCLISSVIGSVAFFLFLLLAGDWFFSLLGENQLSTLWYLIPLGLFMSVLNVIFINWNVRNKEFKKNASSQVAKSVSKRGGEILYGSTIGGVFPGLVIADIVSKAIGTVFLGARNMIGEVKSLKNISNKDVNERLKEFKKYPTYIMGSNFINKFTGDIPLYLLAASFGEGAVGAFGFATQMMNIPFTVIGNSIAPVYFQRANELHLNNPEKLKEFTLSSYNKMLSMGCLAFGLIFGFGDIIFKFVFSDEWELAGQMAMLLSIYFVFKLISSPFARIFRVLRVEEKALSVNIVLAVSRVLGIAIGIYTGNLLYAIGCFSGGSLIGYAFNNFQVFNALNIRTSLIVYKTVIVVVPIFGFFYLLRFAIGYF